jgi:ATP-binding cassette subfamily F protein 3
MARENKRIEAEERNRLYLLRSSLKKDLAEVESSIMEMEQKKKENENILCQPDIYRDPTTVRRLQKELKDIEALLELRYIHWDDLTRHLETL